MAHPPPDKCPANPASAATCPVAHDAPVAPTPAAATGRGDPPEWVDDGTRTAIPQPPERLLVGNLLDIDRQEAIQSLRRLAHLYGPIFQLRLIKLVCFASSRVIVNQLCDENKFEKMLSSALVQVRSFAGDGLFTAYTGEHNWDLAHRILVPAFGPLAIKKMQPMMMEIISQMLLFWEHHAGQPFEAADQYTRLTFDTIGWCAFRYRFNSYHTEKMHPFINIMVDLLLESGNRGHRPGLIQALMFNSELKYQENIKELHRQCDEIVAARKRDPDPDAHDLLNNMLLDKDPKTGEKLSDENIRNQMVTFLIAGHETTSGLLSFATYYLLKNPRVLIKAREEADKVLAEAGGNLNHMNSASLVYIDAICKETLRLQPTAPAFTVTPKSKEGEILPGGYEIPHGQGVTVLLHELQRDPEAWGEDVNDFRPERFLEAPIPKNAWKPFGNGARGCIGRGFAMQEAVLAIALIVNRFDLEMANPSYDLGIKQTLTIKPKDFFIVARPRKDRHQSLLSELIAGGTATAAGENESKKTPVAAGTAKAGGSKLYVLFGSNSGSCEGLAHDIARDGSRRGFDVTLGDLDTVAGTGKLPTDGPVVICTASYEGLPTDNARMFYASLRANSKDTMKGVKFSVMGAGHHDWATTFHKVPTYIDERLEELGGERLLPLHKADAGGDIVGDFEEYQTDLWAKLGGDSSGASATATAAAVPAADTGAGGKPSLPVRIVPRSANAAAQRVAAGIDSVGTVSSQDVLVNVSADHPQMNSITIKLPEDQTYHAGDYLAVLPKNPVQAVERVVKHFGIQKDDNIVLSLPGSFLPNDTPINVSDLLSEYVELGQPASKTLLPKLANMCTDLKEREAIKALEDDYVEKVTKARLSLVDILEKYKSCAAPLDFFLANLPKMKIRQYSISSTPLDSYDTVSLTFTVHTVPSADGKTYYPAGVASNYIAFLKPGDKLLCAVKASAEFHLPTDLATPVVMFTAGSGIAPFRGFVMERALQKEAGRKIGPMVLYYGCRTEDDMVYRAELCKWVKDGVLDLRPVFSRSTAQPTSFAGTNTTIVPGAKYVQHRVWEERKQVEDLFHAGAQFYTCGSGAKLGADLRKTLVDIIGQTKKCQEAGNDPQKVYEKLAQNRYKTDVFL